MHELLVTLEKEWAVISGAPLSFMIACLIFGTGVFLFSKFLYKERLTTKDAHIAFLTAQMSGKQASKETESDKAEQIPPNFQWNFVQELAFWQIAWLWVDQEPIPSVKPGTPAYPVLQMLKRDAEGGELPHRLSSEGTINTWAIARRVDLKKYAMNKGESVRPKFLFDSQ